MTTAFATLDDDLLEAYARTAYGFGTYDADYWFVGIEQGSDGTCDEIARRLAAWNDRGRTEIDDLFEYHRAFKADHWWTGPRPRLQSTWRQLIRLMLTAEGRGDDNEEIRQYQVGKLGRRNGQTCLLELLPLPATNTDATSWSYGFWSSLPQLATRDQYVQHYAARRASHIRRLVQEHAPSVVVFYSGDARYRPLWESIADVPLEKIDRLGTRLGTNGATVFVIVNHPRAKGPGLGNEYFQQVGYAIRAARRGAAPRRN